MARARRRVSAMKGRRQPVRKDWVYTEEGYFGSTFSIGVGLAAIPLTYSTNAFRSIPFGPANALPLSATYAGGFTRPEGRRQVVYAVRGEVTWGLPGTWAAGNEMHGCWRLIIGDMNPENGDAILPAAYDLWSSTATIEFQGFRNQRDTLAEGRFHRVFTAGGGTAGMVTQFIKWNAGPRGRALDEDQAVFLLLELGPNSVSMSRCYNYLRTLMRAP